MATSSITYAVRFRWWALPVMVVALLTPRCIGFTWANGRRCWNLRRWLDRIAEKGVIITPLQDKDVSRGPQA